jgi:hypothetical protein
VFLRAEISTNKITKPKVEIEYYDRQKKGPGKRQAKTNKLRLNKETVKDLTASKEQR